MERNRLRAIRTSLLRMYIWRISTKSSRTTSNANTAQEWYIVRVCKAWWMQYIRPSHQRRSRLANRTTFEEIKYAIRKGGSNKAPGHDGIGAAFYKENWETKMTCAKSWIGCCYTVLKQQNHGVVVCLPKPNGTQALEGYRPITLLNKDYKILARIIARRIHLVMAKIMLATQTTSHQVEYITCQLVP